MHCRERVDSIREICPNVDFCMGDLRDSETVRQAVQGCQGVISASGTRNFEGGDPNRPEMVDFLGVRCLAESFFDAQLEEDLLMMLSEDIGDEGEIGNDGNGANSVDMERPVMTNEPQVSGASRFVLLSSLGVTRPERFPQLQQMGSMMTYKLYGEETLRQCGCPYTIVRPGGLTDSPGRKARLLIDQGDRIAGSISRQDVAEICVEALFRDNATNMTFECVAQPGVAGNGFTPAMFSQLLPDES